MRIRLASIGILLAAAWLAFPTPAHAEAGSTPALEIGMGTQGVLSYEEAGIRLPLGPGGFCLGLKVRFLSSLTWATFIDMRTSQSVSFHPDVIGGALSFGGASPLLHGFLRAHGAAEILLGYSFTPWDSAVYGVANLIGNNLTFAVLGSYGIEVFTSDSMSVCLDAGGGWKSLFGDKSNPYAVASSWLGSGFGFRMSMRFYL